jgi:hypothetical protein
LRHPPLAYRFHPRIAVLMLSSGVVIQTAFGHPRHLAIQMQCIVVPMMLAYGSMPGFLVPQYGHGLVLCHFLACDVVFFMVCLP